MSQSSIFVGNTPLELSSKSISGRFTNLEGEPYFMIENYDQMPPFFMSIVSPSDHWLFLSSTGSLTAGRKDADHAVFPYYTDDKIHDSPDLTGSKSIFLVERDGKKYLWEPFSDKYEGAYRIRRNLYKHIFGHKIVFEEINEDLCLRFRYSWNTGERFGFIRQADLLNVGEGFVKVEMLDGVQNLLPAGVSQAMQNERSTLVDAYKKGELEAETGLGLFALSAILVDKPEPSEALRTTTVWSEGIEAEGYLLCVRQLDAFRTGASITPEEDIRAERGAYLVHAHFSLLPQHNHRWSLAIEGEQDLADVIALQGLLMGDEDLRILLDADIEEGTEKLASIVGSADGLQYAADELSSARHFSNVLFNVMRGGIFWNNENVPTRDFLRFIQTHNQALADRLEPHINKMDDEVPYADLFTLSKDPHAQRLAYEYLPLYFSRRHGDPSRPWNRFTIRTQDEQGNPIFHYEGNWRDIFQNWEALSWSYPAFIFSMIAKFVNASTADGYNPYRITRDGIDWEVLDPEDPWAYIGYWGDHQIIYLLKLMEVADKFYPGGLQAMLNQNIFAFANVPYRIKPFEQLLVDPHETIDFDEKAEQEIEARVEAVGSDGKLIWDPKESVYLVNLTEKLLITSLTKLSNLVLEGGIWMNTQRPEWNDANNALVGYGISVVTLNYLRRFQVFCHALFEGSAATVKVSREVAVWFEASMKAFEKAAKKIPSEISDRDRYDILAALGEPASAYRLKIYEEGFSGKAKSLKKEQILHFFSLTQTIIDHSLKANEREDKLYHAYNLLKRREEKEISLRYLYEMLEGQVAALSSGMLNPTEAADLLDALKASALFREDQYSYLLYPNRQLPRFTAKNNIPQEDFDGIQLFDLMLSRNDERLVKQDILGGGHFHGDIRNASDIELILEQLEKEEAYQKLVKKERKAILDIFEKMFDHQSFTGRSGTFFGYEGLGSIYWHMVSKLLLAVGENYFGAVKAGASKDVLTRLVAHYYEIRAGIGLNKSPELYGAFPTDPYSHTPAHLGAQQPGMTGQVKEDILSRYLELGLLVEEGKIHFQPFLLRQMEFSTHSQPFFFYNVKGAKEYIELPPQSLAFTFCQTLIIYRRDEQAHISVFYADGTQKEINDAMLDKETSRSIFERKGEILRLEVGIKPYLA